MSSDFTFFISVFDTELQNVILSYPEISASLGRRGNGSVVVQCLSDLVSSAARLEETRETYHMTVGENALH